MSDDLFSWKPPGSPDKKPPQEPQQPGRPAPRPPPPPAPSPSAMDLGMEALKRISAHNEDMIRLLVPLAQELAQQAKSRGRDGITTTDLRIAAVERGILTGQEKGKTLSYLGSVMRRAGLVNTGTVR